MKIDPHHFRYQYDAGPLPLEDLKRGEFEIGNCRRAVQDYLFCKHKLYLSPEQILLPNGYHHTGNFITKDCRIDFSLYKSGDIIYAERIKDKEGENVDKSRQQFATENDWITHLHSAIYIDPHSIYHATAIQGETCMWSIDKFNIYYKIIAVKRVLKQ